MLKTLKLYKGEVRSAEAVATDLAELGYTGVREVVHEGEFRQRGEVVDVFAAGFDYPIRIEWDWDTIVRIRGYDLETVVFVDSHDILFIPPALAKRRKRIYDEETPLDFTLDLEEGDYVVHITHGIGRYLGRRYIETTAGFKHVLEIEFDRGEKLSVSVDQAELVRKYVSFSRRPPKLSRLGGKEWAATKARAQKAIRQYAVELVREEALRILLGGTPYAERTFEAEFNATFPYRETDDQLRSWDEVRGDMESDRPMDRLLCGDVGYGKTEVAIRAAFKAVMNGYQVAFLVPTTILAEQHYLNFRNRLTSFPVRVEMLSRFRSPKEQKQIVQELREGRVDIIVGTHRLLSKDVTFSKLGMLIIDEEQRFGVRQKQRLKQKRVGVDVLTLTATPIPRTLYMGLSGIRNISILRTPPRNRLAVVSEVTTFDSELIRTAIMREVERGGQVFFIENWIKNIPRTIARLKAVLPASVRIAVAHGRTPPHELEIIMRDFMDRKYDCLVSTAIIESGIDIPMANTLIVNNAHMYGLADLHQLRGRVGRLDRQAYAYFLTPARRELPEDAQKRLDSITDYAYLGAGFDIAMRDLELRGAGNILGEEQHGFIFQIGLDLYCRLLRIEVEQQKEQYQLNR